MVDQPSGPQWGAPPPPPPPPPAPPAAWTTPSPFRSLRGLATAMTVLLVAAGVLAAVAVPIALHERQVVHDATRSGAFLVSGDVRDAIDATNGIAGFYFLVFLAIAVLWMIWMWRAARNTTLFHRFTPRFAAGFAIGGWFIPLANWIIPGMHMYDIDRGSGLPLPPGQRPRGSGLVVMWWVVFVVGWVGSAFGQLTVETGHRYDVSGFDTRNTGFVVGAAVSIVAAVLAILVVRSITRAQHDAWAVMTQGRPAPAATEPWAPGAASAAPAAWTPGPPAPAPTPGPAPDTPVAPPPPPPAPTEWPGPPRSDP